MLAILQFIFSSFWIWVGCLIFIGAFMDGTAIIIRAMRSPKKQKKISK